MMGKKKIKKQKNERIDEVFGEVFYFIPDATLDFHEFKQLTPYDIEKTLFEFIEDSHVSKNDKILIITGKGAVVRPTVEKLLKRSKYVENFKRAGYFNGQDGAFEVTLVH